MPNGILDEPAFRRVSRHLNPYQMKEGLEKWLVEIKARVKGAQDKRIELKFNPNGHEQNTVEDSLRIFHTGNLSIREKSR